MSLPGGVDDEDVGRGFGGVEMPDGAGGVEDGGGGGGVHAGEVVVLLGGCDVALLAGG